MDEATRTINLIEAALRGDAQIRPCILCNTPTMGRGVLMPDDSQAFGAPTGKHRICVYAMCEKHEQNEANATEIENRLLMQMAIGVKQ